MVKNSFSVRSEDTSQRAGDAARKVRSPSTQHRIQPQHRLHHRKPPTTANSNIHDDDGYDDYYNDSSSGASSKTSPTKDRSGSQGIVKPTPTLLSRAGFYHGEPLPTGWGEGRIPQPHPPLPAQARQLLKPHHPPHPRDKAGGGEAGGKPPGLLAFRSLWGVAPPPPGPRLHGGGLGALESSDLRRGSPHPLPTGLGVPQSAAVPGLPLPLYPGLVAAGVGPGRDPLHHLYPWLLARHSHCFGYTFPGCAEASFLYHLHRKPKRIRTAFSPSQLLRLEHAFDNNHYVVGQERKELASKLSLTETQVKVWFQNRRTKYKRMKAEEDSGSGKAVEEQTEHSTRSDQSPGPSNPEPEEDVGSCADNTEEDTELPDSENEGVSDVNTEPSVNTDFSSSL